MKKSTKYRFPEWSIEPDTKLEVLDELHNYGPDTWRFFGKKAAQAAESKASSIVAEAKAMFPGNELGAANYLLNLVRALADMQDEIWLDEDTPDDDEQ